MSSTSIRLPSAGGSANPSGADTQVQFNDAGAFGGDAGLTYNKTTDTLTSGSVIFAPAANTTGLSNTANTLTGANAQPLINLAQTWNTTGAPTAILANITDTASNLSSNLMDLRVGGVSRFTVGKLGEITFSVNSSLTDSIGAAIRLTTSSTNPFISIGGNTAGYLGFTNFNTNLSDVRLSRDAAAILAQRNGVNSQSYRLYKSFTDASNHTRLALSFDANGVLITGESAGTGDANIDITITPKGTGRVRYGTHSAVGAEVITGFIEIKDASGTIRKLAVIS